MNVADISNDRFVVIAEAKDYRDPLFLRDLTFGRLVDDVLVPFEKKETIWVDGYPLNTEKLVRLKVARQKPSFVTALNHLNHFLNHGATEARKLYGVQYHTRLKAILFEQTEDVTTQVFRAFSISIKPALKDYMPKREELISAALTVFVEGMKKLSSTS